MEETISSRFLDSLWEFSSRDFPEEVYEQAKSCLVDYIGCTTLGASVLKDAAKRFLSAFSHEGSCSIIGTDLKNDVLSAALLNGIHAHAIELDDGHRFGMIHVGAVVNSALISVAQDQKVSGDDLLRGIIVAYEATIRLASAIQPGHKLKAFHATGTCATIGSAIGIASMLHCDRKQWNAILSAAATSAAGLLEMSDDSSQLKPYNIGHAAMAAVTAAYYSVSLLDGPSDILGGDRGFFKACADKVKEERLFSDGYEIMKIYRKPYAACRHAHAPIEAALKIMAEHSLNVKEIDAIKIETYALALKGHSHKTIKNTDSAKMSIPYDVAAAIRYGKVNYEQFFEECLNDKLLNEILEKITISEDPELSALVPNKRAAKVTISSNGNEYSCRIDDPLGEPENPLSKEDLETKYFSLMAAAGKDRELSEEILNSIYNIDDKFDALLKEI